MNDLKDRIKACYLGKNIGGTLGTPWEGRKHFLDLDFYDPVPSEPAANDDLDLQLVWLEHLKEFGFGITAEQFGGAWIDHIDFHPDEYGVAIANLKKGIQPPLSGVHNNYFATALGGAIRSEIWSSLFPGRPATAAHYAYLDGSVDHCGDGVLIVMYLAILESDLYVSGDLHKSLALAFAALPESRIRSVIKAVQDAFENGLSYEEARDMVFRDFFSANCSDAVMNMGFIMIGLLYGGGDFEKSVLMAVNCGQDTDSTAATVGSIMGIWLGTAGIPERWRQPIGDVIRMSPCILNMKAPATVEELADEIIAMSEKAARELLPEVQFPIVLPEVNDFSDKVLWLVNGRKVEMDGFILDIASLNPPRNADVVLETDVVSPVDREVRLLTCAAGYNKFYFDGVYLGQWGADKGTPIPAYHRTSGGLCWRLKLKAGQKHRIRIAIWSVDKELEPVYCGIADTGNEGRILTDIKWGI